MLKKTSQTNKTTETKQGKDQKQCTLSIRLKKISPMSLLSNIYIRSGGSRIFI